MNFSIPNTVIFKLNQLIFVILLFKYNIFIEPERKENIIHRGKINSDFHIFRCHNNIFMTHIWSVILREKGTKLKIPE